MWSVRFLTVLASLPVLAGCASAAVPEFPTKPLRYISASAPGGASDLIARTVGAALSEILGVQVVVENRAGAGNTIGAEIAARAAPDGHTIFGCNIASLAVSPALYKKLGYDPDRDLAPIGLIASNPNVLTVHPSLPAATITQFISLAKAHPGKLNYGSAGVGSSPQLSMELFRMQAHINIVHIAYKGVAPALLDLIGGRIEAMFSTMPSVLPAVRRGKVRALGVTSTQRDPDLPEVPTIAESALPEFEVVSWQGLCTQVGVPQAALARLRAALAAALDQPDVRKRLADQGFQPHVMPADQLAAFARTERAKWAKVVKEIGVQPQ
ncbi:MAG: Bug family tripartite tricarboxylate transporter substrate binding protein [Burkholderiales bacterium]